MKTSEVFKLAKRYLAKNNKEIDGIFEKQEYICLAIQGAYWNEPELHGKGYCVDRAKAIISDRLGGLQSFEEWLDLHHNIKAPDIYSSFNMDEECTVFVDKLQATRHKWVNSMIKEFAAKGD